MQQNHGGNIRAAAKEYNLDPAEIIDFSANINFLGPPESVTKALKNNLKGIKDYPDPECNQLKTIIAKQENLEEDNLVIGNGAVELIYLLATVLSPREALVLAPTFSEYRLAIESVGGSIEEFQLQKEEGFRFNLDDLLPRLDNIDIFFLCNPNNPTGKFITREDIIEIINYAASQDTFLVVDEAFVDFLEEDITVIDLVKQYDNLFVLRSLTKFFAIPGLRLGYGATNKELIKKLNASKDPWNVNCLAQLAGEKALNDKEYIKQTEEAILREKEFLYQKLNQFSKFKVYYPHANYILVDLENSNLTSTRLEEKLAQQGILVRNCNTYSGLGEDFIRVAVKSRENNLELINRL
ncbi:L-threonine-O-3-phosphate decarboxylase/histidinol-phosphate aminotransferase [Halobacteroides halobius DSM 5150]|uniref:threonine-phosphate decarboxylase n=1 Tax=Halobacteroides halobius (strain ATCC 35273 / DSM 5150 / MD-1) TaxID=748449 RepID=L0KB72_HALHC|nr:threonine-phosphate decarboxylase CobD [Halobacteroides halobius]AGB41634.1 L-threonine-O-3-phosphate decarboxylase/histidinol-phosphate aminotransferase [Halobacteroides halobius DSM 5150]